MSAIALGAFGFNWGVSHGPEDSLHLARLAEDLGYDSIWVPEHVVAPSPRVAPSPMEPGEPIMDPLIHLAFLAASTHRISLATGIVVLPQRNPLVLAKQVASLDRLSGGRMILGIGAGYLEPELVAVGVPIRDCGSRTDDYLAAMRALWTVAGPVSYHGRFVSFSGVEAHPQPARLGGVTVVVGGHSRAAFRRAVASAHGWYGYTLTADQVAVCVEGLRRAAGEVKRPEWLGSLELSVTPRDKLDARLIETLSRAGIDRIIVGPAFGAATPEQVEERLRVAIAPVS